MSTVSKGVMANCIGGEAKCITVCRDPKDGYTIDVWVEYETDHNERLSLASCPVFWAAHILASALSEALECPSRCKE